MVKHLSTSPHANVGDIVVGVTGKLYRLASKLVTPASLKVRLVPWWGKLAFRQEFDLYVKGYIEQFNSTHPDNQLPLEPIGPDGKPFRWAKWFQSEIAPKLHVKQKGEQGSELKDEAIHEMLFTVMGQRQALDKFGEKIKNFHADIQKLDVAKQLTVYLVSAFKFRISEMQKKINQQAPTLGFELEEHLEDLMSELNAAKTKKQRESVQLRIEETQQELGQLGEYKDAPREMSMYQPAESEDEGEFNIIEQERYGVGEDDFASADAKRDIARFRTGFARWLEHTQGKKASGMVTLFDLYWALVSSAGKDKVRDDAKRTKKEQKRDESAGWMVSRGDLEKEWMGKTGLSFGAFKEYLGLLPGIIEEYITSHREAIGEDNAIVAFMDKINQERGKARPAHVSALNLAGVEDDKTAGFTNDGTEIKDPDENCSKCRGRGNIKRPGEMYDDRCDCTIVKKQEKQGASDEYEDHVKPNNKTEMIRSIRPGDRVTILVPAGRGRNGQEWKESTGRAVMPSSHGGWVLNMGGAHGTPGVCDENNIVRVQKRKGAATKTAQLISGSELTPEMRKQVTNAFIYRWTKDNPKRTQVYHCDQCDIRDPYVNEKSAEGHQHPTIPLISDDQWIREHAFHFTNDGRLSTRGEGSHAMPAYLAQHSEERMASVAQKFAVLKAATAAEQFACCDGFGAHQDNCSVKDTASASKRTAASSAYELESGGGYSFAPGTGYAPQAPAKTDSSNSQQMECGRVLEKHGYKQFHSSDKAQYYKHPVGTTATVYKDGRWTHSGGDTVNGETVPALEDRLLKYHHEMVPKMGADGKTAYSGDPRWLTAKYPASCKKCGRQIKPGERMFYYPQTKTVYCDGECGQAASRDFGSAAFDDEMPKMGADDAGQAEESEGQAEQSVAQTILEQLGGRKFTAMTGAKNLVGGKDSLSFRLPGGGGFTKNGINGVRIVLLPSDTYKVTFSRIRGSKVTVVSEHDDIYVDALREVFEQETGLRTSLGTMGRNAAGSNSGNDDARGAGDLWRETYYETQEGIAPKAMMNGLKKEGEVNTRGTETLVAYIVDTDGVTESAATAATLAEINQFFRLHGIDDLENVKVRDQGDKVIYVYLRPSLQKKGFSDKWAALPKTAQGSGNTTTTMQEQNVTNPSVPGKGQPMAVPEAVDQTAGPHSPNSPMTAPRTPGIQPKIVTVPQGTEGEGIPVQGAKTADLFDDDVAEASIENDLPTMSQEDKEQWLLDHGWAKEEEHHGPSWWLGVQQWFKPGYEEDIPYIDLEGAIEKELEQQSKDEENDALIGTCRECGAATGTEGTICSDCEAQGGVKTSAENCQECGKALNNADGDYCSACLAQRTEDDDPFDKESAAAAAAPAPVSPNVAQNTSIQRPAIAEPPNSMVGIMPSGGAEDERERRTIEPELPNAKYHMSGLDDLVSAEETKLASRAKFAGHFYETVRGEGKNQKEAEASAIADFLHEHGHRHDIREVLKPTLIEKKPPQKQVSKPGPGGNTYITFEPDEKAPKDKWLEVWEFELHTHA